MKYQLWTEDEYRTSAIVGSFASPESAAETARKLVTDANFSNALSTTDRMRNTIRKVLLAIPCSMEATGEAANTFLISLLALNLQSLSQRILL